MARCYVRNGVWAWSVERQIKELGELWDADASFRDALPADRARAAGRVRPEWLVERAALLRPSGRRSETIYVATLLVIAVTESDLVKVILAAAGRNAAIMAQDSRFTIPAHATAEVVGAAITDWQRAKMLARTTGGRLIGVEVAAERRRADTARKVKVARPLWRDRRKRRLSTEQVAEEVGLSVKTLYQELGRRPRIGKESGDE